MSNGKSHIGVIGLAVMGENLALNIARNGFAPVVYNRTAAVTDEFLAGRGAGTGITAAYTIQELIDSLESPRRIIMMVKAGAPVDAVKDELAPLLEPGDIVIDGGNSLFTDTERRAAEYETQGLNFVGMGVSGGEEGALWGPSLMPGGSEVAWKSLQPVLEAIAAKSDSGPCVTHIGPGGSGHYVKMVHNGIEYGDMQLIAETYDIMRNSLKMSAPEIGQVFQRWNEGKLSSFLVEITAIVLQYIDEDTGLPLVDFIRDQAAQKGTGRWTSINSYELGTPIPVIDAAVVARSLSSFAADRELASGVLTGPDAVPDLSDQRDEIINQLENALYVAKVISYTQGMSLLRVASETYNWNLKLSELARIWKAGCIIRARLLDPIMKAFQDEPELRNLMLSPYFTDDVNSGIADLRGVITVAVISGVPTPAYSAALNYFDTVRDVRLPANLIQELRDYFGAHTFERTDRPGTFHIEWMEVEKPQANQ
ncbi:MAG: NADP-dependent phosphogluconate dehydrogenase [Thermomicrobiales bacterium]|nr:NADP-dependent phosphogluconate dehydrogenase [Thermomicrobiales bacterium]MCO5224690.1 NADP-dependent phosphogluconate dehydrogenase [Thermomicrobiales bacterium]